MKKLLVTIGILLLVALTATILVLSSAKDIPPIDDTDLYAEVTVKDLLGPDHNAWQLLIDAADAWVEPADPDAWDRHAYDDLATFDAVHVASVWTANHRAVELLLEANNTETAGPVYATSELRFDLVLTHLGHIRSLMQLVSLETERRRQAGAHAEAADLCLDTLATVRRCAPHHSTLVEMLVAMACDGILTSRLEKLTDDPACPEGVLSRIAERLAALPSLTPGLVAAYRGEYVCVRNLMSDLNNGSAFELFHAMGLPGPAGLDKVPLLENFLIQPNKMMAIHATQMRHIIGIATADAATAAATPFPMDFKSMNTPFRGFNPFAYENMGGELLLGMILPHLSGSLTNLRNLELHRALLTARIGVELFRRRTGRWPATLDDLVPDFLPQVPRDPWSGRTLKWDPKRRILWSVGEDLTDDGGHTEDPTDDFWREQGGWDNWRDSSLMKDPTWRLTAPSE